jgi:lipid-binding SYLF domain-containing protein
MKLNILITPAITLTLALMALRGSPAQAASAAELTQKSRAALNHLYSVNAKAHELGQHAKAVLVFPEIVKAGFIVGAQRGDGVLFAHGRVAGFYNTTAASYGLQAGVQKFGYAMFFMDNNALGYLRRSGGWELGSAPSVVVVDEGFARGLSTTSIRKGIYAFFFGQRGLMAGLGLQGTKITQFTPSD